MYTPSSFREDRPEVLEQFIRDVGLGTLVTRGTGGLAANHLPFVFSAEGAVVTLRGHLARANPQWKDLLENSEALVIFLGPHAYVTPQWYPTKLEHARVVPTWNYATVHAHGTARVIEDPTWLRANVTALTEQHEAQFAHQWAVSDAPEDYLDKMIASIVGVEIAVSRLDGKWKLSQPREERDRVGVAAGLAHRQGASLAVADMMKERRPDIPGT